MNTQTLIDPCYLKTSQEKYMQELHGYNSKPKTGFTTGDRGKFRDYPFTYLRIGSDGHFEGADIDSGSLLLFDTELPASAIKEDAGHHTNLQPHVAKNILAYLLDKEQKRLAKIEEHRLWAFRRAKDLVKKWGIRGAREIQRNRGRYFITTLSFREWSGRKLSPQISGEFLVETLNENRVEIHLPGGRSVIKDLYSRHITETQPVLKRTPLTRRSFLQRKARLAKITQA